MNAVKTPLVSVVIPTYNHAAFLSKALKSVFEQTYQNWEIIIVDNYSRDNTVDVVRDFKDQRVTLLQIQNNGVIAASRNMGIRKAKGEWIAFLDSDDLWYPHKLEIVMKELRENPHNDVVSTDEMLFNEVSGSEKLLQYGPCHRNFYKHLLVKGNCLSPSATVVKRSFLNNNNILFRENKEFVTAEDYDFWMILAKAGAKVKFLHSVQGQFLVHKTNNSGDIENHTKSIMNVIRDHVYVLQDFEPKKDKLWKNINSRLLMANSKDLIMEKKFVEGVRSILNAFRNSLSGSLGYVFSRVMKVVKKKFTIKRNL